MPTMAFSKPSLAATMCTAPPAQRPSSRSCKIPALCKVRVVFSKPVHAVRAWGGRVPTMAFSKPSLAATMCTAPPTQRPSSLSCKIPALCKVRVVFSKPVHAVRPWGGPPGANHGLFKAKTSSHHVHSTLSVTPPTSPCPTLSADAESARKRTETIFSAQCAV